MQGSISLIKGNKVLSKPPTEECLFIEEFIGGPFQTQASVITVTSQEQKEHKTSPCQCTGN